MTYSQRLRPLFIADLLIGFMFYWSIIFPFMHRQGLTTTQLGVYVIVSNVVVLALEVPSGILADRWSRKYVAMIGIMALATGILLLARAHSFVEFMIGAIFTSAYFALNSGMKEAMIYDTLLEGDSQSDYEKQLGKLRSLNTIGVVISSILGGIVASIWSFSAPFYLSFVSCMLALMFLATFREPRLHKEVETAKLLEHIRNLLGLLSHQREV